MRGPLLLAILTTKSSYSQEIEEPLDGPQTCRIPYNGGLRQHCGDIISVQHQFDFANCADKSETDAALLAAGLEPRIEIAAGRFAFWKPDDARYRTQSAEVN